MTATVEGEVPGRAATRGQDAPGAAGRRPPADPMADAAADQALLDAMAVGALTWLDGMRRFFRPPADAATASDPNRTLKPLGELAELSHLIRDHHPLPAARELAGGLFRFAWEAAGEGRLFAELVRDEPQATYPVELYGAFARAGLRHAGTERLVEATTSLRHWRVAGGDHTRTLAVLNAERRIGLPMHADFDAVLAHTGLGRRSEPWVLDLLGMYGITHDVFHLTDWGRAPHRMPAQLAEYLRLWTPAWTLNWLDEQLWDLVGELLAVAACVPGAPHDSAAWLRLAAAQRPDGAVPETGPPPPAGLPPEELFPACYHSTLVTAFAATLARVAAVPPTSSAAPHRESETLP